MKSRFNLSGDGVMRQVGVSHHDHGFNLIELKPNKRPIGYHHTETPFTSTKFNLEKDDLIILFSDGYADQFGGEKGKKLKSSQFRNELLLTADMKNTDMYEHIKKFLTDWMGSFDQLDDITVMGIKIN